MADPATQRENGKTYTPLLLNPCTAKIFCRNMATRLEPLATADGNPIKINKGSVINEPPPATVLINPAKSPATISNIPSNKLIGQIVMGFETF